MFNREAVKKRLKTDEDVKFIPYIDSVGKVTVGCGRNIQDVGISPDEMELMLDNDVNRAVANLDKNLPWWRQMDDVRQEVIINMAFNMGADSNKKGLLTFVNTLASMKAGNYVEAAKGMRQSKWYGQVHSRGERLALMMETGIAV